MRSRGRGVRIQFDAEGEHQCLVVRERHPVRLPSVSTDDLDELVLVVGAGLEPAVAMNHLVHDSSPRP